MIFEDEITIHLTEPHFGDRHEDHWDKHERQGILSRHCSYCGSLHPEDMYKLLLQCDRAEFADRKYGYPHKLYIDIDKAMLKFYTRHLIDLKDKETVQKILDKIQELTGVKLLSHLEEDDIKQRA